MYASTVETKKFTEGHKGKKAKRNEDHLAKKKKKNLFKIKFQRELPNSIMCFPHQMIHVDVQMLILLFIAKLSAYVGIIHHLNAWIFIFYCICI